MKTTAPFAPLTISLKQCQQEVFDCPTRFRILVAGRRFGKTYLAVAEALRVALLPNRRIWYVGPNDKQTKRLVWELLKQLTRYLWSKGPSEVDMRIDLANGSTIFVSGTFRPSSLRGEGIDLVIIDEFASVHADAWAQVFRPSLADRKGRALLMGTPMGHNHFYDLVQRALTRPNWRVFYFTTAEGEVVDAEELAEAKGDMDIETFRQEFEGEFTSASVNRTYSAFDRLVNVKPLEFQALYPLIWSLDFNVNPMSMLLMQNIDDEVHVLQEIIVPDATTEAACTRFHQQVNLYASRVPAYQHPLSVKVYGDASGSQRRTSAANTDWGIVTNFFNPWKGYYTATIMTAKTNPAVRDRVNCVNARLHNALDDVRLFINPQCRELIRDLEQVSWALDKHGRVTSDLDKSDRARTHTSDALGYYVSQEFNLLPKMGHQCNPLPLY